MKKIILLSILSVIFYNTQAQESLRQTVRGTVREKLSLTPIEYATVLIGNESKQLYALTDSLGEFQVEKVPIGKQNVAISRIGYKRTVITLNVNSGRETIIDVLLEEDVKELEEVVVTNKVNKTQALNAMAIVSSRIFSMDEASRYAGAWGDPARMVSNLAGVSASNDSRNDIVIRGNSPLGVQWRLEGFNIYNPNHFGALAGSGGSVGIINNNLLTNSDFYTGAFPAEFGNVTSGIFDLRYRNGNNRKREYLLAFGFNGLEAGAEGYISKKTGSTYLVNGRYSFLGILNDIGMKITNSNGATPEYQDLSLKFNFPLQNGNLSLIGLLGNSHINMKDDMKDESEWTFGDLGQDVNMKNNQIFTGVNYTIRGKRNFRVENRISYQHFNTKQEVYTVSFQETDRYKNLTSDIKENLLTYESLFCIYPNRQNYFKIGIGADYYMTDMYDAKFTHNHVLPLHDAERNSLLLKTFGEWRYTINDALTIVSGIHSQYYNMSEEITIEPRLSAKYQLSNSIALNAGSGLYSQIQSRQVLFYQKDGANINDNLGMTKSWQNVIGFDWLLSASLRLKTELYYQYLFNVPVIPDIPQESILNMGDDFRNNWDYAFINKGSGKNYGIDVTLEKFYDNNFYYLLTFSLYNSTYKGYDGVSRNTKFNGNYALNTLAGYSWQIGKNNSLSANAKVAYMGGRRYTPAIVSGSTVAEREYDHSKAYENRLPDYFKIDLNLNFKMNFRHLALEWFLEVTNITNNENIWLQYYNVNQQKERYIYQQGFMPMAGIKAYF